ncbi:MAG: DUF4194 domain-containing protein [Eubacteriales bacterium]|nr:DUF4194 domain-containing protein [Eubacteriales bacterium]
MELLQGLSQGDKENFRRICNKLISVCFICKKKEDTRSDYYFLLRHKQLFKQYIEILGYKLNINEEYGVIQLVNQQNYNRINLKLFESIILLILRILYDEKKRELSLDNDIIIDVGEIQDKFMALKIRDKLIDKTTLGNALRIFRRFQLLEPLDKDLTRADSRILLYDSILMAVKVDDIKEAYGKIEIYRKGGDTDEETDADEVDPLA